MRLGVVIVVVVVAALRAQADPIEDEVTRGEELGRQGSWTQAIAHFKAADALAPRAKHACLIGLAYSRRELWAEAEVFFALCHQRAMPADPTPEWLPDAEQQLADKLAASDVSAITLHVDPPDADIAVSSFAPGETFHARTIHLPAGAHVITVTAPGFVSAKQEILVTTNTPREVSVTLQRATPRSRVPWVLFATAGGLAIAGLVLDDLAQGPRGELDVTLQADYDQALAAGAKSRFETRRNIALGLLAGAAVSAAVGVVWRLVIDQPPPIRIGAEVGTGTAAITIEWSR